MNVELNELEDWMLENACEDSGFVADLPQVASRIYGEGKSAELRARAATALIRLVELGAIELGYERRGSDRLIPSTGIDSLFLSGAVWERGAPMEKLVIYWATDRGMSINDGIDAEAKPRASQVHAGAWEDSD